jgi:putative endonuclease
MACKQNLNLGKAGEEEALRFLKSKGYKLLRQNYKTKLGEIDIIAQDRETLCFIEVKTRSSDMFGHPSEALTPAKQKKLSQLALIFLKEHNLIEKKARFDVVTIMHSKDKAIDFKLIKDAFPLAESFTY